MRLFLVSHAETEWNAQGRLQGHTDVPLNDRGRRQAQALQARLRHEPLAKIVSSDLARAWQTASIVALPHGLAVQPEPRLREMHFGTWEGLTYVQIEQTDAVRLASWREDPLGFEPPSGERLTDLAHRLRAFLRDLTHQPKEGPLLLVAHRGALRALLCCLLEVPLAKHWDFLLDIASLSELEMSEGKARVVRLNETVGEA